jgi:carboxypeptidase C (cathepsin A)
MAKNPSLRVFVGSGYYDLATPYLATNYTFNHLGLEAGQANRVTLSYYDGGHMMYTDKGSLVRLKADLAKFFQETLAR